MYPLLIDLIYILSLSKVAAQEKEELDLSGATTSQIGTWAQFFPDLAIDGNYNTYSVGCILCDPENTDSFAWWRIDFHRDVDLAGVQLVSVAEDPDSNFLGEIDALVILADDDLKIIKIEKCGHFDDGEFVISYHQIINIICSEILKVRSVIIQRKFTASFRQNAISIAEANFYSAIGNWAYVEGIGSLRKPYINITREGPKYTKEPLMGTMTNFIDSSQSGTTKSSFSSLAIDGNNKTFSIAISNGTSNWEHAWWQGDLGKSYLINGLTIVSPSSWDYAGYLKNIIIYVTQYKYEDDKSFHKAQTCDSISDPDEMLPRNLYSYKCFIPMDGRYIIIKSLTGYVCLAEVKAYVL